MEINQRTSFLYRPFPASHLALFRILFGTLMFFSILRFILKGWVKSLYITPKIFFPYYGFEWVKPLSDTGMYVVFGILLLASAFIALGFFYRVSIVIFFLLFTYVELIDKSNYLNHYYFISLVSFLMIGVPASSAFSLDNRIFQKEDIQTIPYFYVWILRMQLFVLYFFAGLAKVNSDWLFYALPLKIWLAPFTHFPLIGHWMDKVWVAYLFSWFGCIYDLCIGFLLFKKKYFPISYALVILFHGATALFFNIGMFPWIMMAITLIFIPEEISERIVLRLKNIFRYKINNEYHAPIRVSWEWRNIMMIFFIFQFLLPLRYAAYGGNLFWHESGFRFSWRVMLMEKAGTALFFVQDRKSGREVEVSPREYLTYVQDKMMSTQPDMITDFASFLKNEYEKKGWKDPKVRAQVYVTLNGRPSSLYFSDTLDLTRIEDSPWKKRTWLYEAPR